MANQTFSIDELRNNYYEAVVNLHDRDEIISALPKPDFSNFYIIMKGVIEKLEETIKELEQESLSAKERDYLEYIRDEIDLLKYKIELCNHLLHQADVITEIEETPNHDCHLIFASNVSGTFFERDLKSIPEDYYGSVLYCLERLLSGEEEDNLSKARQLKNNSKLSNLHEIKDFKIRVLFKKLSHNCIFVMLVRMKKDDNSRVDREEPFLRTRNTDSQYELLKVELEDDEKRQAIIDENDIIRDRIFAKLTEERREGNGRKN